LGQHGKRRRQPAIPFLLLRLPDRFRWRDLAVVGCASGIGIGFTVALFFASAAFPRGTLLNETKIGALRPGDLARRLGGRDVLDDEHAFAGLDQPELAPGDFFDGRRILAEAPGLVAEPGIFSPLTRNGRGEIVVFVTRAKHRQQSAVADEAVDDNDRCDEQHQELNDSPVPRRALERGSPALRRRPGFGFFRHPKKQYTNWRESTRAMTECILVLTTMPADDRADGLARTLVGERLAACVNIHAPMTSTYRWQGKFEVDAERQVVIKTTRERLAALELRLRELHPYELPELIVLDASASDAYAAWISETTSTRGPI
jgi:periplasmic divalent cation tolerance protein